MNKTKIEYLTHTWNPIAMRCAPVSEGCKNCWHLTLANRLAKNPLIPKDRQIAYAGGKPVLIEKELHFLGTRTEKPTIVGVQFMGDLFYESVPFEWIAAVFGIMLHSYCTFLVLTKRAERMLEFFNWINAKAPARRQAWIDVVADAEKSCGETVGNRGAGKACGHEFVVSDYADKYAHSGSITVGNWPLKNVCIGVTVENQQTANERIPILLQIPAAVRFVSCEPLLSEIDFSHLPESGAELDWVIVGGESGPRARPMHTDWARSIRDQCKKAGVPYFFKQWGEWTAEKGWYLKENMSRCKSMIVDRDDQDYVGVSMGKVGKNKAGRMLDGRIWDEYPKQKDNQHA